MPARLPEMDRSGLYRTPSCLAMNGMAGITGISSGMTA